MQIKQGQIIGLSEHRLAVGDCRDPYLIEKLLGGETIDLLLTDPPYSCGYVEGKAGFSQISKDKVIANDEEKTEEQYREFSSQWLTALVPHLANKNTFYIFQSDRMVFALKKSLDDNDFKLAQLLVWIKNQPVMNRLDYLGQHESIAYGWRGSHKFRKSKDKTVLFYPRPSCSRLHPTMKPVGLLRRLILNSSKIGDIVFDGFLGSGSTLLASEQTKRRCFGVELDIEYCQTIIDRWEKLTGQKARVL
ncbi:MAG: site-specific DNA-methyltransferase [Pseudomonadales bacterium]|jgi:site-specific DNA-methyltransferase (adenine-specific)|nr:site-specific DNA-methyltransferase [Pseudomonadales bacterium]